MAGIAAWDEKILEIADALGIPQNARGWRLFVEWDEIVRVECDLVVRADAVNAKLIRRTYRLEEVGDEEVLGDIGGGAAPGGVRDGGEREAGGVHGAAGGEGVGDA